MYDMNLLKELEARLLSAGCELYGFVFTREAPVMLVRGDREVVAPIAASVGLVVTARP